MPDVAFARWDPIRDLLAIQQRLDRFAPAAVGWKPPLDLLETPDAFVITAELPGVSFEDLQIHIHDGRLTLSGERRDRSGSCEQFHRLERGHGSFIRTIHLPIAVDTERVTAELQNGVLTVTCPKVVEGTALRVQIT